ncbi:MAG: chromate transporter [Leptospiraceae bacterium]|nr:chromate transporter [Leptospiraceae bacterium]
MTALKVYLLMVKLTLLSFGGAYSIWALLDSAVAVNCQTGQILSENTGALMVCRSEFSAIFALGEVLPGPQVNAISILAFRQFGVIGMLTVLAGMLSPGLILVPLARKFQGRFDGSAFMAGFYQGAAVATLAILCVFLLQLTRSATFRHNTLHVPAIFFLLVAFVLSYRFRWNPLLIVSSGAAAGYFFLQ